MSNALYIYKKDLDIFSGNRRNFACSVNIAWEVRSQASPAVQIWREGERNRYR